METMQLDGNNILEVYEGIKTAAAKVRQESKPILVECMTFRIIGHEEASGTKYYPEGIVEKWSHMDPVSSYETYLVQEKVLSANDIKNIRLALQTEINAAISTADS